MNLSILKNRFIGLTIVNNHLKKALNTEYKVINDCKKFNIPQSTFYYSINKYNSLELPGIIKTFINDPIGYNFLKKIIYSGIFSLIKAGNTSIRTFIDFLKISELDKIFASSIGYIHKLCCIIDDNISEYKDVILENFIEQMDQKIISIAQDETFFKGNPWLVSIEPVSNFILYEIQSADRKSETWLNFTENMVENFRNKLKIFQVVSDEGKSIMTQTKELEAFHSPDLFHIIQDLKKGISRPLSAKINANIILKEETENRMTVLKEQLNKLTSKNDQGKYNEIESEIFSMSEKYHEYYYKIEEYKRIQEEVNKRIKEINFLYHPISVKTGVPNNPKEIGIN
jgi:hypothetical protein